MRRRLSGNIGSLSLIFRKEREMKFEIYSTCIFDIDFLLENYPMLNNFGFEVVEKQESIKRNVVIWDENRNPIKQIQDCSRTVRKGYVTLNSLDQLKELIETVGNEIVILPPSVISGDGIYRIEIYDGYRE